MNLLLLDPSELQENRVLLQDRRAQHILQILKKAPGETLKAGVIGRGKCTATVLAIEGRHVRLELGELHPVESPRAQLIIATPRPKGLSRLLQTAASFGVSHIDLISAYRVDKSYFDSPRLAPERIREDLWLGCEQGGQAWLPSFTVQRSLRDFLTDVLPARLRDAPSPLGVNNFLLHPDAPRTFLDVRFPPAGPLRLCLGPEGGWTEGELAAFEKLDFQRLRLGSAILRTETAMAVALGQVELTRELSALPAGR